MPVTRARPGWRPWIPVVLYVSAFAAVIWLGFNGLTPVEFDTNLLPESCRVTYTLDRTQHQYGELSAHDVYFRFSGTPSELAGELSRSGLMHHFRLSSGVGLTYVRDDGRVVLRFSGGDSALPWDRTSYVVHSEEYAEPQDFYVKQAMN